MQRKFPSGTYTFSLGKDLAEKAKNELNENPDRRADDIKAIKEWIKKQPHLPELDDYFIIQFLRQMKFSLEETKTRIDNYLTVKTAVPEWYEKMDPGLQEYEKMFAKAHFVFMPGYDNLGRKVCIAKPDFSLDNAYFETMVRYELMQIRIHQYDEQTQICGAVLIVDMSGFSAGHVAFFTPNLLKRVIYVAQSCEPVRVALISLINLPKIAEMLMNMALKMLSEKMRKKVRIHADMESLYEAVSKDILPIEYGGTNKHIKEHSDFWKQEVMLYKDELKREMELKSNESKRPGKPKTTSDLFGLDGSFRKLELD